MRALPLWQPYASLVALGAKRVETRPLPPWSWRYGIQPGQRIAIHATKTTHDPGPPRFPLRDLCGEWPFSEHTPDWDLLPLGAIICTAILDRAREITAESAAHLKQRNPIEHAFGDYQPGRWAWVLRDIQQLPHPVPFRGSQGTFDVPDELLTSAQPAQGVLL